MFGIKVHFIKISIILIAYSFGVSFGGVAYAQPLTDVVKWTESIQLEEPENVYTVSPEIRIDPAGGFIVTDIQESQVRLYDRDGTLRHYFGEQGGEAPGSFDSPTAALRLSSGQILVPDRGNGHLSLFEEDGTFVERYANVVRPGTHQVFPLVDEKVVLLVGSEGLDNHEATVRATPHLFHRYDVEANRVVNSFFPYPMSPGTHEGYLFTIGQIAAADVRSQHIVGAFALSSTLYFFDTEGNSIREVTLALEGFQPFEAPPSSLTQEELLEVSESHSRISDVFWIDDETILIQYFEFEDIGWDGASVQWNLAAATLEGEVLFEISDTPQLFTVNPETGKLFFSHPDHDFENHLIVGQLADRS